MKIKYFFDTEYRAVLSFRIYSYIYLNISKSIGYVLYNHSKLKYGNDIAPTTKIGKNFRIAHTGGIVIGRNSIIGDNCVINNNVTLGMKNSFSFDMPKVGNNVYISTGAKLLGSITIGDFCTIGANAVVTKSFDSNLTVAGIPARIIKSSHE
jgi:serine O-acetyltransferase